MNDRLFTNLLNINITETRREGIKSSNDEDFLIIQTQTCLIKNYENRKFFIFDESCVKKTVHCGIDKGR